MSTFIAIATFEHTRYQDGLVPSNGPVPLYIGQRIGQVWARSVHEALDAAAERAVAHSMSVPGGLGSLLRVEVITPAGETWVRDLGMAEFVRQRNRRSTD